MKHLDKLKHFAVGFAIAAVVTLLFAPYTDRALGAAAAAVLIAAAGKEVWDKLTGRGTADGWDIVATLAGWVAWAIVFSY